MQILLIDDDVALTSMLSEYLAGEGVSAEVANHGEAGLTALAAGHFDAVVLDVMLPRMSGMDVLRLIRQKYAVPVIMLTAKGSDVDRVLGLEMGADDYVAKPFNPRELVARLRAVLRRTRGEVVPEQSDHLEFGDLCLQPAERLLLCKQQALEVTATEFNILEILLRAGNRVVRKDELFAEVLGRPREIYDRSIDVHVSNLRQKLQTADAGVQLETVRGIGYRLRKSL